MTSSLSAKRLIIRLSSLGDVVLATSALSVLGQGENHWVVSKEYAGLLKGHSNLRRVWEFDREKGGGLLDWLELCAELWREGFTEVLDLHSTWRSRVAKLYFSIRSLLSKRPVTWKTMDKERVRLNGLFVAKALWPKNWYPTPLVERSARLAGGTGAERPDLSYLVLPKSELTKDLGAWMSTHPDYLCVMPSSKWDGKKWGVRGFYEVLRHSEVPAIILGNKNDRESRLLVKTLEQAGLPHLDGVGRFSFRELATALAGARAYIGNDTGLAHLSEAVGTDVVTIFGPTIPGLGFGPWRPNSRAVGVDLWCKPCGKDGRRCYRFNDRYACQKRLQPDVVLKELEIFLRADERVAGERLR